VTAQRKEAVICVDDEEGVLRVLRAQLGARFGHECQVLTARSGDEAVALFDELAREGEQIALVIADQIMPGMKGVELLEIVDRRLPSTMKILLTGQAGLDAVIDAINRAHLNQYIAKPWDETALLLAVENLLRQFRLVHENQQLIASLSAKNQALLEMNRELEAKIHERTHELAAANARLAQLAVTDGLTGLYNHRHFHERLALEVERSQRSGLPLSLLMLDVDHFKQFNDSFGHPAGDEVLRQLARVFADTRRANDVVARYGGEEFAVILVDTAKFTAAKVAGAGRLRLMFKEVLPNCVAPLIVQATLGISTAILDAAALGFLGLGAQPPLPEWGTMLADAREFVLRAWWVVTLPGIAILVTVLAFNLLGDGLRDALDPKLKR